MTISTTGACRKTELSVAVAGIRDKVMQCDAQRCIHDAANRHGYLYDGNPTFDGSVLYLRFVRAAGPISHDDRLMREIEALPSVLGATVSPTRTA